MERAIAKSDLPAPARHIVLTLAIWSDAKTAVIPGEHTQSLSELAKSTGLGESTVKRCLNLLEKEGWIKRERPEQEAARKGARTSYALAIPVSFAPASSPGRP